ncbi:uncharacterized protein [Salvelinus alpinus]|uniref:uncharacterized protein n=1 Tax=Salvelinus alpinus TaxID=8036 RepID=UPI0039FBCF33
MSEPSSGCGVPVQRSSQPGPETVSVKLEDCVSVKLEDCVSVKLEDCSQTLELNVIVKKEEKGHVKEEESEIKEDKEEGEKREVQVEEERNADMAPPGESSNSGSLGEPNTTVAGNQQQHRRRNSRQKRHHCMDCFTSFYEPEELRRHTCKDRSHVITCPPKRKKTSSSFSPILPPVLPQFSFIIVSANGDPSKHKDICDESLNQARKPTSISNHVDFLLTNRYTLSQEEKLQIKSLGPHQPPDVEITLPQHRTKGKDPTRSFNTSWFHKKSWLTASVAKKALYCFPCLLFGKEGTWSTVGFKDLKHLSERISKHESCCTHLENGMKLGFLGKTNAAGQLVSVNPSSIEIHNRQTEENRYVLGRMVKCYVLCGRHMAATWWRSGRVESDSLNTSMFKCIFETMCEGDSRLQRHYDAHGFFKHPRGCVQNKLFDCMHEVYKEAITKEVGAASFVAVQVDGMPWTGEVSSRVTLPLATDLGSASPLPTLTISVENAILAQDQLLGLTIYSCTPQQVSVVLRYMLPDNSVTERFWEFVDLKDKTAAGLTNAVKDSLEPLKLEHKLIAQTYDGVAAAAVDGADVRDLETHLKRTYPNANFVHCYAHPLRVTLQQICSATATRLKVFFADLSLFETFFQDQPKRATAAGWNCERETVRVVWENRVALQKCVEDIRTQPMWDQDSIREAYGLSAKLRDSTFLQLLELFYLVMQEVDVLTVNIHKRDIVVADIEQAVDSFEKYVQAQQGRAEATAHVGPTSDNTKTTAAVMRKACDIIVTHVHHRFSQGSDHLIAAKLVNPTLFSKFVGCFPCSALQCAAKLWPVVNTGKLKDELTSLYQHTELHRGTTALSLLKTISELNLQDVLSETVSLLKIIITTPMQTAESDRRLPTLKRIQALPCSRNTSGSAVAWQQNNGRLNALSMLSVEKDFIQGLRSDFHDKVVDKFVQNKTCPGAFLFK